ncbi:MAG: tRNA preQ1(34) S-adenosylmethionine ribosyltransferase-isomerase QueA, partial [Armatimonadota bacterium]
PGSPLIFESQFPAIVEAGANEPKRRLRFEGNPDLSRVGTVPLPPYITAKLDEESRYDTTYATAPGSAAAPTAGLHFTPDLLNEVRTQGISTVTVTLHVGLDTFRPVEAENLADHRMHGESALIAPAVAETMNERRGRLIAVGTTSVRTLESFAEEDGRVHAGEMQTSLFIRPGYRFRAVSGMMTNFHLPRTTMLAMISALAGYENIRAAYAEAIREEYRFLSFGDSMLILPDEGVASHQIRSSALEV